jgi:hypothetical protein
MWLLRVITIALGLVCIVVGPVAAYKGLQIMKSGMNSGTVREVKGGFPVLACGIVMVPMGFFLFYAAFSF